MVRHAASAGGTMGMVLADGASLPFPDRSIDLAIAFMSLQDMDDMAACVVDLARVLEPGGRLCLAVTHPLNTARTIVEDDFPPTPALPREGGGSSDDASLRGRWVLDGGAYFTPRRTADTVERDGLRMTFHSNHRPMEDYFKALEAAGLLTETIREPRGTGSMTSEFPWFLHVRARKP